MKVSVVQPVGNHFLLMCQVNLENPFRYITTQYIQESILIHFISWLHIWHTVLVTHTHSKNEYAISNK